MGKKIMSGSLRARLDAAIRSNRRDTIYRMIAKKNEGMVPCYVCGRHVKKSCASLEHVIPVSKGGTDDIGNLSISHWQCNKRRGNGDSGLLCAMAHQSDTSHSKAKEA